MAFPLSPGVTVSEVDLTTVVPSVATTIGGFAGEFTWGPVEEITVVPNEVRLVSTFGEPNDTNFTSFFTASNFLAYGTDLRLVRAANTTSYNARSNTNASAVQIKNGTDYLQNYSDGTNTNQWVAKYPGTYGNNVAIAIADSNTFTGWAFASGFSSAPATSTYATGLNGSNDEIHVVVYDASTSANTILEKYAFVSKASDAKNSDGTSNYYKEVINRKSGFVWWTKHPTQGTNWGSTATSTSFTLLASSLNYVLAGGTNVTPTTGDLTRAYDLFENEDAVDVSFLMTGAHGTTVADEVITICETRKDCIAFVSPAKNDVVDDVGSEANNIITTRNSLTSSSFAFMDSGWKYQYDKYNDVYRWVPLNGDIAGICSRSDQTRDPWYSPAGFNRGILRNVVKLAWNPTKAERDTLYSKGVNPVVSFPGEGTMLYGDKTLLSRPSAFDRINVRRLFIVLQKSISRAARSSLFEFNDEFTRASFVGLVEPFLRDVQGRRGITDFRVVCDESNNTPEVIDRNEFVGDIYVKPARSINFIQLNFVAVRTGVRFDEIVGQF
jgi:phage tail sheath protein FI